MTSTVSSRSRKRGPWILERAYIVSCGLGPSWSRLPRTRHPVGQGGSGSGAARRRLLGEKKRKVNPNVIVFSLLQPRRTSNRWSSPLPSSSATPPFVVGRSLVVSEHDLPNLPFLYAVVKETLSHHPAAPLSLPRLVSEDCEVDGCLIPLGSTVLVNIWAIGRDLVAWPDDPLAFRPDRFLDGGDDKDVDVRGSDFELIQFGPGRRFCAGMNLGLRMVQFIKATLVHAFDWELPEKLDMNLSFGLTLHRTVPLMVRPVPRLESVAYA
ncbi:Flavonoid 3'-monooxygenase [Apostasia shenzhenica]|uniref:Flavonoid 3'-monooxygenase n=1 Tax=Apostasia shenzhenica TaxID=1088818 RepID=A0A2I0A2H3_9ASPA|nr:Flavonoid 3'-monooxygenase [Apostasia shenzhenica]